MKRVLNTLLSLVVAFQISTPVYAQNTQSYIVVSSCGTLPVGLTLTAGRVQYGTMDTTGKVCTSASASTAALGTPTDNRNDSTDTTSNTMIGLLKQLIYEMDNPTASQPLGLVRLGDSNSKVLGVDPCQDVALTKTPFNVTVASTSLSSIIAAQSSKTTYICWLKVETDGTGETVSIVEAAHTTTACDGSKTALEGSTTAANGVAIAANSGFRVGDGGYAVYSTSAASHEICALNLSTNPVHFTGQWAARQ